MSDNPELDTMLDRAAAEQELDDDEVEIDLSDAGDDADFEPFSGPRLVRITKAAFKLAKSSGAPMIDCAAVVIDKQNRNRKLWFNLMLTGKGVYLAKQAYNAAGIEVDWTAVKPKIRPKALINAEIVANCVAKAAEGGYKAKTDVNSFTAATSTATEGGDAPK